MNQAEIILETIEFYGQDPNRRGIRRDTRRQRNLDGSFEEVETRSCEYAITNGDTRYCAVGRCLTDEAKAWVVGIAGDISELIEEWWTSFYDGEHDEEREEQEEYYLDDMLAPEYQGFSKRFWEELQLFHDTDAYWSTDSDKWLTSSGRVQAFDLIDAYALPDQRTAFMKTIATRSERSEILSNDER